MPTYSYLCKNCKHEQDVFHSMNEKPEINCPDCNGLMTKAPCMFSIGHGESRLQRLQKDKVKRHSEMKEELYRDYGVEKIEPVQQRSFDDIYRDVKSSGGLVKEKFAATSEMNAKKTKEKQREWKRKAATRVEKRTQEMLERKKAQAASDRAVRL